MTGSAVDRTVAVLAKRIGHLCDLWETDDSSSMRFVHGMSAELRAVLGEVVGAVVPVHRAAAEPWPFSDEEAARVIAALAWPMERRENRDGWAPKMLDPDCDFRDETVGRAQRRLASAVAAVSGPVAERCALGHLTWAVGCCCDDRLMADPHRPCCPHVAGQGEDRA